MTERSRVLVATRVNATPARACFAEWWQVLLQNLRDRV
jgi:hypothetical protein